MKKILIVVHVGRHLRLFSHSDAKLYLELGHEVHVASNFIDDMDKPSDEHKNSYRLHQVDFCRSPFSIQNIKAYKQLKKLIEDNHYDIIHTQMAIAGVLGRFAARHLDNTIIIHTSHGFSFYRNGSKIKNLLFSFIEKKMAKYSDSIITMNNEDYEAVTLMKEKYKGLDIYKIDGVGVDLSRFSLDNKSTEDCTLSNLYGKKILITIGELSKRKNHVVLLKAMQNLPDEYHLLICGKGELFGFLTDYIRRNGLVGKVTLLGFRKDIPSLLARSDLFVFSSLSEGLPVSIMEAMALGLPVVASNVRGNSDIITDGRNGYLVHFKSHKAFSDKIRLIFNDTEKTNQMSKNNLNDVKKYSTDIVSKYLMNIYSKYL